MRRIFLCKKSGSATIDFALSELSKYIRLVDKEILIDQATVLSFDEKTDIMLYVGLLSDETEKDDRVIIDVTEGRGYISGSNERSVLFAVYKYLEHLGCRWYRPGIDGEFIPKKALTKEDLTYSYDYTPSYHHRGICLEGCVNYEIITNIISWLPKMGMNEYFIQFHNPWHFFNYNTFYNPEYTFSKEETALITRRVEEEIALRGLSYHKVGHGWTYPLVGEEGHGWSNYDKEVPEDVKSLFAEIDGKRDLWKGNLFNTNLCYSNPEARDRMTDGIVNYLKKNPKVDYLHFWLADAINNHCECEECRKMRPSDYYVLMLNELDEKLTKEGISAKVVFLLYLDLMFPPEHYTIKNPDRFTLMFAPISRKYNKTMKEIHEDENPGAIEYVRNKVSFNDAPTGYLVNFLSDWQKIFKGDSFIFDYHLMWNYQTEAGSFRNANVLHDDMKNLKDFGIDGMVSCQLQRVWAPINLSMYGMCRALWDRESEFSDVSEEYFRGTFHRDGDKISGYLKKLSDLYYSDDDTKYDKIVSEIDAMLPFIKEGLSEATPGTPNEMSWKYLLRHGEYTRLAHIALSLYEKGDEGAIDARKKCQDYVVSLDPEIRDGMDIHQYARLTTTHGIPAGLWSLPEKK